MKFSANLGFLWTDRTLPDAIHAAAEAGFDAVECHWPYETDPIEIKAALRDTGLPMLGLNTTRGNVADGDNGLSAVPGREETARIAIDAAFAYADAIDAKAVHVMAGKAEGAEADATFRSNLDYALARADGRLLLIEPLNQCDAPGYFLKNIAQARTLVDAFAAPNLRIMFDCYHVARTEGDVLGLLEQHLPAIGHIQFASVPERGAPDQGTLDYRTVFKAISDIGWQKPLGAEYKPDGPAEQSLKWMTSLQP